MSTKFVMFTSAHTKKPVLVNRDHVRTATEVDGHNRVRAGPDRLNRIPRRLSGLLPGLVLCNFARGA